MGGRHRGSPDCGAVPAETSCVESNTHPFRGEFSSDGVARAASLLEHSSEARRVACRRHLAGLTHASAGPILQRFFPGGFSQHAAGNGRCFWRMDALVLRRSAGRRARWTACKGLIKRPNLLAGEDLPPEPVQKRSLEKRSRLKLAALALFSEKGYERTSIEDVAERAKLAVGTFYQHFRSKRQLLLALMDELLEKLSRLELRPTGGQDVRAGLHALLSRAFSEDLRYLGAYRAWQEAALADPVFARKQRQIHAWTSGRVETVFKLLQQAPGARHGVDISSLAKVMDGFFWSLLAQAAAMEKTELKQWIDAATHLIYHALIED